MKNEPFIFAQLADKPGFYACLTYQTPDDDATDAEVTAWIQRDDSGPLYSEVAFDANHSALPVLKSKDARDVAEHAYYSGADVMIAARVRAERGQEALVDYADTQNMYSMPGAPDIPEDQLKWVGSGLTPTVVQQGA